MKKYIVLLILLTGFTGYSQQQQYHLDFEAGSPSGVASNWFTFDNNPAAAEVVDNPDLDGTNTADSKVLKVVVGPANAFYAGVNNGWNEKAFGTWKIDMAVTSNLTLSMDVHKSHVGTVGIKMGTAGQGTSFQITDQNVGNTVVDEWQTLTWDLSGINPNGDLTNISQMVVFVDWTEGMPNRAEGTTVYIDNIKFNAEKLTNAPTVGGGIDPMDDFEGNGNITWAADGDTGMDIAFANPSSTGINTSATVLEYSDTGQQYANINFDLSTDTSVKYDLSTKNVFTLKVFVPTPDVAVTSAKTLDLKLQDHSSSTPWVGQQAVSVAYEYDVWQELTFDFSAQSGATNFSRIVVQFNGENNFEVVKAYIDDLSYGEAATAGVESNVLLGFSMYPNPASNRLNISATETIQNAEIYNILGKNVMSVNVNDTKVSLDISNLAAGIYIVKYNANDKIGSAKFIKQ